MCLHFGQKALCQGSEGCAGGYRALHLSLDGANERPRSKEAGKALTGREVVRLWTVLDPATEVGVHFHGCCPRTPQACRLCAAPPAPGPRYLAACSARSVSRAKWSVPKKSTRQGGFSRTRGARPSSPPAPDSARHWEPGMGLDPPHAPPAATPRPQQRGTRTLIASRSRGAHTAHARPGHVGRAWPRGGA